MSGDRWRHDLDSLGAPPPTMSEPRPPAAESGTPAPEEVGRERIAEAIWRALEPESADVRWEDNYARDRWYVAADAVAGYVPCDECGHARGQHVDHCHVRGCDCAAYEVPASLLSASPASETPRHVGYTRDNCPVCKPNPGPPPASETPGPGEGDLRGNHAEGRDCADAEQRIEWLTSVLASTDKWAREAVEQRSLAEQKVARVEALLDRKGVRTWNSELRAALDGKDLTR